MYNLNNIFVYVAAFITLLALVSSEEEALKVMGVDMNTLDSNPAKAAVLTQLNVTKSNVGDVIYTYKCTVGTFSSNILVCTGRDSASWPSARGVKLNLRCPESGSGTALSYVEIIYSVTSQSVNCFVHEGALELGYIGLTVQAWNTFLFSYAANVYAI